MKKLENLFAVITGGSSGIGLATAQLFIEQGARVAVVGRDAKKLEAAVAALGANAIGLPCDVAQPAELAKVMAAASAHGGGIDILFANAGVSDVPATGETEEADFDAFMAINAKGVFFSVTQAMPYLNRHASIILTGSVAARKGRPGDPLYAGSKGFVRSFGRSLAMADDILMAKIRVNVLTPGATETPLTQRATEDQEVNRHIATMVPMGRWGKASEVAQAALFLASADASYITGEEITVDGGLAHV